MSLRASLAGMPILEKYELLEEIGHGGMATVYRAKDKRLGREVAVKVIHKHLRENDEVAARFIAEARAAAKLKHPGIVEVFDVSAEDDRYRYLVVELIRGTTLRRFLQDHRDLPAEIGAAMVLQLCDALGHAHEAGIIHRDIKPENVLVESSGAVEGGQDRDGDPKPAGPRSSTPAPSSSSSANRKRDHVTLKVTDFGIAKMLDAQGVTSTGQVLGSPAHMAPEQIEGGDVDPRTDVFALGVLFYEAIVGHLPFEGKNPAQVLRRVLDGKYPAAEVERPTVGVRWSKIVAAALARDPVERIATPAELADHIRDELAALGITDVGAELCAYFRDSDAASKSLVDRLVPALLARGEAAKRAGDVHGAAADFNRALALRPDDLTILKRITSLSTSQSRRLLVRRALMIAGSSAVLGLLSFAGARMLRPGAVTPPPTPTTQEAQEDPDLADETDPIVADPDATTEPTSSPTAKIPKLRLSAQLPSAVQSAIVSGARDKRRVRFNIVPGGGSFALDGREMPNWLNQILELPVGPHSVRVSVPDSTCCEEYRGTVTVTRPPPDQPELVENFSLRAIFRPATVRLVGAPKDGQLLCATLGMSLFAGQSTQVKLPEPRWTGTCEFRPPDANAAGKKAGVILRAGEENALPWVK